MTGSGLSLERFIRGKAQRTKSQAKATRKKIIYKAQRKREYTKVLNRERNDESEASNRTSDQRPSFYDNFDVEQNALKNPEIQTQLQTLLDVLVG